MRLLNCRIACVAGAALVAWGALPVGAAVDWWAVEAMSNVRRLPDTEPTDGVKGGTVRIVAAKGEYEPASIVLRSDKSLKGVTLTVGDLKKVKGKGQGQGEGVIPASAVDVTVVKCWYQSGTAWHGFHNDSLRHILTPELLLHDETLVKADPVTKDDYLRCRTYDGRVSYLWVDYTPEYTRVMPYYSGFYPFREEWIEDARTLQPFALDAGKYKQLWLTLHVPAKAAAGLYKGAVKVASRSGESKIPLLVRVLPFELPAPSAFRDLKRPFYNTTELGPDEVILAGHPRVVENMAAHNMHYPMLRTGDSALRDALSPEYASTLGTNLFFTVLPYANMLLSNPAQPDDNHYVSFMSFKRALTNSVAKLRARYGDKADLYAYGRDEASPGQVLAQREAWRAVHQAGGKVFTSSRNRPFIQFGVDAQQIAGQPAPVRKKMVDAIHDANPEALVGWYADPHTGPENPDYVRLLCGWKTWRNSYDMVGQYVLARDAWAEFCRPAETYLRSLTYAYPQKEALIDTLQWEGMREGVDDVRYGSCLMALADEAKASPSVDVQYLGRIARTWLAHVDYEQSSLKTLRLEMISRILAIRKALGKRE